ncbi:endonuclease/exonuclease/phosphatase family protein [Brevibacterium sp. NPDC049920]
MSHSALIGPIRPPGLHVTSFNIRRRGGLLGSRRLDRWTERRWLVRELLRAEQPTVLGVQEALPDQAAWVRDSLGPDYRSVGRGRSADGSDEGIPILYDSRRLELLGWNQLALSDTPEQPGSRSWGNLIPRAVVTAEFADQRTGERFTAINTHLDHLSPRSRLRSAHMLGALAAAQPGAVVLTVDANCRVGSPPYGVLTREGGLRDSWTTAEHRLTEEWATYSGYRPPRTGGRRIDWILVSAGITVHAAGINAARFAGRAASDHEPVHAALTIEW